LDSVYQVCLFIDAFRKQPFKVIVDIIIPPFTVFVVVFCLLLLIFVPIFVFHYFLMVFFFFWWYWDLNSELCACWANCFCSNYFGQCVSHFFCACFLALAGMTGACYHTQFFSIRLGSPKLFCSI
jgi:hypothetical protein